MKRLPLWCSVPAGVLAAHAIGYVLAYRNALHRESVLSATGHGYVRQAAVVAVVGAAVAVSTSVARGVRDAKRTRWWDAAVRISVLQAAAFFGVEVLERIAADVSPLAGMSRVLVIGAAVQIAMGAVVALVLALLEGAGRTIAGVSSALRPRTIAANGLLHPVVERTPSAVFVLADTARGPPLLLVTT
jgi:hypothetical protein